MLHEFPPRASDPNAVIAELEKLFRGVVGDKISFRTHLDPQLGLVPTDPTTLRQVLVNLAVSAVKAMLARNVVVTTSSMELDEGAASKMNVSPGSYIQIELGVTCSGVDAESATWNVVQEAHGALRVCDGGPRGVTVTVLLPSIPLEQRDRKPSV